MHARIEQLPTTTPGRSNDRRPTNMSSVLDMMSIWLSTMIMMLLMGSRSFQSFIRSGRKITRSPSMLLDSNIRMIDALNRELPLPYEHFRYWPVVLARLQCDFRGLPGESHIVNKQFGLFRTARKQQTEVMIAFDHWERSVFPGDRLLMSIDVEQIDPNECPSCGCTPKETHLMPVFSKWFVVSVSAMHSLTLTPSKCQMRSICAHFTR